MRKMNTTPNNNIQVIQTSAAKSELMKLLTELKRRRVVGDRTTTIEYIVTPALALELLGASAPERQLSQVYVKRYVRDIQNGAWPLSHQGVAIGPSGERGDGQ